MRKQTPVSFIYVTKYTEDICFNSIMKRFSYNFSFVNVNHSATQEKSILLNHIAELEHQLFQLKTRLNEPLSKLESLMEKLAAPLPREFRYQQVNQTL